MEREERVRDGGEVNVIQHKNIVNLKLEISHIKNLEIAFGFLWPRLIHGFQARGKQSTKSNKIPKSKGNAGCVAEQRGFGWWVEEGGRGGGVECEGLASSPLPHIFNELDIKKF